MSGLTGNVFRQGTLALEAPVCWRPIHYLGSKLRLTESIRDHLSRLDSSDGPACDLFAGSGTVSLALSRDRNMVAADIQEYSRVLCTALLKPVLSGDMTAALLRKIEDQRNRLENALVPILQVEQRAIQSASATPTLLCDLVERGSLLSLEEGCDSLAVALRETRKWIEGEGDALLATRYFGGIYFSYRQTLYIDCVLNAIRDLPPGLRESYLSALLSTASTIVNTVGKQFAQPMRPRRGDGTIKQHLISQMCRDRRLDAAKVFDGWVARYSELPKRGCHRIMRGDYRETLRELRDVSVIYADPPYTRDHYSRFYHVLETLCLRDFPGVSTTLLTGEGTASRGIYRTDRHQSPFCIKSQAPKAFADLFEGARRLGVPILVSYSPFVKDGHPRLMTVEAVSKLATEYYREVKITPAGSVAHSKLTKTEFHRGVSDAAEVFIVCRN